MKNIIAYTVAALAFVSATAAMAAYGAPAVLAHVDQSTIDAMWLAAQAGVPF